MTKEEKKERECLKCQRFAYCAFTCWYNEISKDTIITFENMFNLNIHNWIYEEAAQRCKYFKG